MRSRLRSRLSWAGQLVIVCWVCVPPVACSEEQEASEAPDTASIDEGERLGAEDSFRDAGSQADESPLEPDAAAATDGDGGEDVSSDPARDADAGSDRGDGSGAEPDAVDDAPGGDALADADAGDASDAADGGAPSYTSPAGPPHAELGGYFGFWDGQGIDRFALAEDGELMVLHWPEPLLDDPTLLVESLGQRVENQRNLAYWGFEPPAHVVLDQEAMVLHELHDWRNALDGYGVAYRGWGLDEGDDRYPVTSGPTFGVLYLRRQGKFAQSNLTVAQDGTAHVIWREGLEYGYGGSGLDVWYAVCTREGCSNAEVVWTAEHVPGAAAVGVLADGRPLAVVWDVTYSLVRVLLRGDDGFHEVEALAVPGFAESEAVALELRQGYGRTVLVASGSYEVLGLQFPLVEVFELHESGWQPLATLEYPVDLIAEPGLSYVQSRLTEAHGLVVHTALCTDPASSDGTRVDYCRSVSWRLFRESDGFALRQAEVGGESASAIGPDGEVYRLANWMTAEVVETAPAEGPPYTYPDLPAGDVYLTGTGNGWGAIYYTDAWGDVQLVTGYLYTRCSLAGRNPGVVQIGCEVEDPGGPFAPTRIQQRLDESMGFYTQDRVAACGGGSGAVVAQEDGSLRVQIDSVAICRQSGGATYPSTFETIYVPLHDPRTE